MTPLDPAFLTRPLAHRGYHNLANGIPENSPAAFRAAIASGYGIELDVQLSADGRAMVFHDYKLDRLTARTGVVRHLTAAELAAIPLTGGEEGIPTLAETLALVAGRAPLLIEIKDQDGAMGPNIGPLEAAVAAALKNYAGPVAVMSYNPNAVAHLAALVPGIPRGIVTEGYPPDHYPQLPEAARTRLRDIAEFDLVGADFISHDKSDLDRPRVAELKAAGVPVLCWTVRSPEQEAQARMVADNITFEGYPAPFSSP